MKLPDNGNLEKIYGESRCSMERYRSLADGFFKKYHRDTAEFFSSPGRTEIIGNHTDHNGGLVIAAAIDMDTICAAWPNGSGVIRITSEGYEGEITVDLSDLDRVEKDQSSTSLVAGMVEAVKKLGFKVYGFDAYVSTNVISAAGVSSSASFEMLICSIVNRFFNGGAMSYVDCARIGQYAENVYWQKASGMMDQLACSVGGTALFDFSGAEPAYRKLDFSFQDGGYQLIIVNTGKGHADLSREYSDIPHEMGEAAEALNVRLLCQTDMESLLSNFDEIKNDRAILRAMHFFKENERVKAAAEAIEQGNTKELLRLIGKSGDSSWKWLQNCYSLQNRTEQKVSLTLALSELFCEEIGDGVCRVHGGGFAGVIACIVPQGERENYIKYISRFVGEKNVYPMNIRAVGAVHIPSGN